MPLSEYGFVYFIDDTHGTIQHFIDQTMFHKFFSCVSFYLESSKELFNLLNVFSEQILYHMKLRRQAPKHLTQTAML